MKNSSNGLALAADTVEQCAEFSKALEEVIGLVAGDDEMLFTRYLLGTIEMTLAEKLHCASEELATHTLDTIKHNVMNMRASYLDHVQEEAQEAKEAGEVH